jgi:hypothetical protein
VSRRLCGQFVFFARKSLILVSLALIGLLAASVARASQGFVVEADRATLEVGAAIEASTPVAVEAGGHIVVMTSAARMIRREGPFEGDGADFLGAPAGAAPEGKALGANLMMGLLALAKESGKSEQTAFGVRGAGTTATTAEAGAYALAAGASVFCVHAGQPPAFFTANPPPRDATLVMRRVTRPKQLLRANWPAAAPRREWPGDWPPPEKGRYLVAIGNTGGWAVRLIEVGPRPREVLRQAAVYYEVGCARQASAALRLAVNGAERQ